MVSWRAMAKPVFVLGATAWLSACWESGKSPAELESPPDTGVTVSDPHPAPSVSTTSRIAGVPKADLARDSVAYVSLPPGSVPGGTFAQIDNVATGASVFTRMVDGGFDPVPIGAATGDTLRVTVSDDTGNTLEIDAQVVAIRPPRVIRTDPSKRTDVALNAAVVVVFSEPIAEATVTTSSVQLWGETGPVDGSLPFIAC